MIDDTIVMKTAPQTEEADDRKALVKWLVLEASNKLRDTLNLRMSRIDRIAAAEVGSRLNRAAEIILADAAEILKLAAELAAARQERER